MTLASSGCQERRASLRHRFERGAPCSLVADGVENSHARIHNLSSDGALLECDTELQPGTRVGVIVDWPNGKSTAGISLHVTGETLRTAGSFTAIKIFESEFRPKATGE